MELEELICEQCDKHWHRTKARGRKPKLCPTCLSSTSLPLIEQDEDVIEDIPLIQEPPLEKTLYKPNSQWQCSACGAKVRIGVGVNIPPVHKCPKRANRLLSLDLI
jgi:hypothetical protein